MPSKYAKLFIAAWTLLALVVIVIAISNAHADETQWINQQEYQFQQKQNLLKQQDFEREQAKLEQIRQQELLDKIVRQRLIEESKKPTQDKYVHP